MADQECPFSFQLSNTPYNAYTILLGMLRWVILDAKASPTINVRKRCAGIFIPSDCEDK